MAKIYKKYVHNIGLWIVYTGMALLAGSCIFDSIHNNVILILSLCLVITGIFVHIAIAKKASKY